MINEKSNLSNMNMADAWKGFTVIPTVTHGSYNSSSIFKQDKQKLFNRRL